MTLVLFGFLLLAVGLNALETWYALGLTPAADLNMFPFPQ